MEVRETIQFMDGGESGGRRDILLEAGRRRGMRSGGGGAIMVYGPAATRTNIHSQHAWRQEL